MTCVFTQNYLHELPTDIQTLILDVYDKLKQQELEQRRRELQREIQQITSLLFEGKKEQKSVLSVVEDLNFKIQVRKNLIRITNQQANQLTRKIIIVLLNFIHGSSLTGKYYVQ